ncbi:cell wall-binding repeat-containing protein [Clostridium kluyveri]|uniref:cell wall-binding repeat-containing protein n=1 Tax=Clostridium kluyveri TaxID=1534 RepID=UPI0022469AB5|nr:cell wall-binding repeat-containing protein [Clostridium kluyveri]UZQ50473.1 cell wall-binding repeat-containing protein [Clostridium kluyveri]
MNKKHIKKFASATLISLVLTTSLTYSPVKASGQIARIGGTTRYETSAQVAKSSWTTPDNAVLVSGEGYADSVSASVLAKVLDAPIILTTPTILSSYATDALEQLKPKNIYVIGGNASISQSIRNNLKNDYNLVELGGANRYETNVAVAKQLVKLGVNANNVLVVGGDGFSDALSVAPIASAKGQILLLANNDKDSIQPVIDFVKNNSSTVTVVGTKNVINTVIYNDFGASSRVDGGNDRFDTNLKVLDKFSDSLKNDKLYLANASAATPDNLYADALIASALAGKYTAPLVLVDKDESDATDNAEDYIAGVYKNNFSANVNVIGGPGVISDYILAQIEKEIPKPQPILATFSANGLKQIKIVFSQEVDKDTSEQVSNYKINDSSLTDAEATASLQDDNKTVFINLAEARTQSYTVTVSSDILSADKSFTTPEITDSVTFKDTTAPTLKSVEIIGNNKLIVEFSEPVCCGSLINGVSSVSSIASKLKINDKNLSQFELNTTGKDPSGVLLSKLDNYVVDSMNNIWANKVEFYFDSVLPTGNNVLKVLKGNSSILEDAAGFSIQETTENFNVDH